MASSDIVEVSSTVYITIAVFMCILFVFGLIENVAVLIVYGSNKDIQTKTNFWICAVIICDLLLVINAIPYVIISCIAKRNVFGDIGCAYDGFIVTVLGTTSIFLLTGLSVHRFGIMMEKNKIKHVGKLTVIKCLVLCLACGLFWGIVPLIGWGSFALEGVGLSCAPNWRSMALRDISYTISIFICVLFIPLLIMGYCYIRVLLKIWREKRIQSDWIKQRRVMRDIRVTISVALTILSFLISWTPYAVISLLEAFHDVDLIQVSPMLVQLPCLFAKAACIWNPLVYVCHNSQFRTAFTKKFGFCRKAKLSYRLTMGSRSPEPNNGTDGAICLQRFNSSLRNQIQNTDYC